nr:hypothetical protein [uncultured Sulfurimonas sp.]
MNSKVYIKYLILIISLFVAYHFVIWHLFTSQIFKPKEGTSVGDLGRMSYQINMLHNRELKYTLPKEHLHKDNFNNQNIDILTIGDSFSNGHALGENPYYQDFLASQLNANVLNIKPYKKYNSLETIIGLLNNGHLAQLKPKIIIIESVERNVIDRFAKSIDYNLIDAEVVIPNKLLKPEDFQIKFINTANYKLPYYMLKYIFYNNAQKYVYKLNLNKKLFSKNNAKNILIFRDDITNIPKFTLENIKKVNKNLNKTANLLKTLNIKLYFMPAPDKYDLYYDFIKDNKYPKNNFFELIRPMEKQYYFIDIKKILLPLLKQGEKDVYWVDDTHWSQKASEAISKDIIFTKH